MYGSSFRWVSLRPRFSISAPMDAEARPLPSELTTPPVTKMNFVFFGRMGQFFRGAARCQAVARPLTARRPMASFNGEARMDAIEMLLAQHREVESYFREL